jgi:DNA-binding transcriptional LysR family regulator
MPRLVECGDSKTDSRTSLRAGYLHDAIPGRVPIALRRTAQDFPRTRVCLTTGDPQKLLDDLRDDLLDVVVISLPAPVSGLRVMSVGFEHAVAAVPTNPDRDDASPLELLAHCTLRTLPRRRNPAFHDARIAGLQAADLPGSLVEIEASSVETLLMEVVCATGCALVPEPVMFRLRTPGVRFRRLAGQTNVGCGIAAVARDTDWSPQLAAFLAAVVQTRHERPLVAA